MKEKSITYLQKLGILVTCERIDKSTHTGEPMADRHNSPLKIQIELFVATSVEIKIQSLFACAPTWSAAFSWLGVLVTCERTNNSTRTGEPMADRYNFT